MGARGATLHKTDSPTEWTPVLGAVFGNLHEHALQCSDCFGKILMLIENSYLIVNWLEDYCTTLNIFIRRNHTIVIAYSQLRNTLIHWEKAIYFTLLKYARKAIRKRTALPWVEPSCWTDTHTPRTGTNF